MFTKINVLVEFPDFVEEYLLCHSLSVLQFDNTRPWGGWYIIDEGDDYLNSSYFKNEFHFAGVQQRMASFDKKILQVLPGNALSLQCHSSGGPLRSHSEMWVSFVKFRLLASYSSVFADKHESLLKNLLIIDVESGGRLFIPAGFMHALVNPFSQDIFISETRISPVSQTPMEREGNIDRIYDQSKRRGIMPFPQHLADKILNPDTLPDLLVKKHEKINLASLHVDNNTA
jgi:hypothetical protein